jgi:hypothetical protein
MLSWRNSLLCWYVIIGIFDTHGVSYLPLVTLLLLDNIVPTCNMRNIHGTFVIGNFVLLCVYLLRVLY